jgi:hypothetical protein
MNLKHEDFERYYPAQFVDTVDRIAGERDNNKRRKLKKDLLEHVLNWMDADTSAAKIAFETSAAEVIAVLRAIETSLVNFPIATAPEPS